MEYLPDPDIGGNWWPHPAYSAQYWREATELPDVVHAHFGFEHVTPDELQETVDAIKARGMPLVVTVHDLDNPHLEDQTDHHARLRILVDAADEVLTLTDCAAGALGGSAVGVVKHPALAAPVDVERAPRAAVFLKSMRTNVVADPQFYGDIAVRVPLDIYAHQPLDGIDAHVHPPMSDAELHAAVARAAVCILPYTRGTHSGWLEMCRDLGTSVVVPDFGCYADQVDTPEAVRVYPAGDGVAAGEVAAELIAQGPVPYAGDRAAQLAQVRAAHAQIYGRLA